jgi:hypothetical protein
MSDDVTIQIQDGAGAAVVVPLSSVQLVIGTCSKGTPGQVIASKSPTTIQTTFGFGQLAEYCCGVIAAGGTVLAMRAGLTTGGYCNGDAVNAHGGTTPTMSGASDTTAPITITATTHGLYTGQVVSIAGTTGQTLVNGTWIVTKATSDTFTIPQVGDTAHAYSGAGTIKTTGVFVNPVLPASPRIAGISGFAQNTTVLGRVLPEVVFGGPLVSAIDKTVVTTFRHELTTGDTVTITGVTTNTSINATQVVTVVDDYTYTVPIGSGTGVITAAGFTRACGAYDDNYVVIAVTNDGNSGSGTTVGSSGIQYRVSLDAGRTFGPATALGTSTWINLAGTGLSVLVHRGLTGTGTGKLYTGDVIVFSTVAMATAVSQASPSHGISQSLLAASASTYSVAGWGSTKILGTWSAANVTSMAADTTGTVDTIAATYDVFTRALIDARDVYPPVIWGGTGETETTWMSDGSVGIVNTFATVGSKRSCVAAGHYNIAASIAGVAGAPSRRRPGGWALGVRQVLIPPQRHAGRVKDGALGGIILDSANDPFDGFVYHDERVNPALDTARFASFTTRKGKPGVYCKNPNLMSSAGSTFTLLPLGNVMDVACDIAHQVGEDRINDDVRLSSAGTIVEKDARVLEGQFDQALKDQMLNKSMISSESTLVDRTNNIATTKNVNVTITIGARGYILTEVISIGYSTPTIA